MHWSHDAMFPGHRRFKPSNIPRLRHSSERRRRGVARILQLPSPDSKQFEEIQRREKRNWNELVAKDDGYFDAKFACRYERRQKEVSLADVIITNSSLTTQSHIRAGADPSKIFTVPLAAPPPDRRSQASASLPRKSLERDLGGIIHIEEGAPTMSLMLGNY